MPVVFDVVEFSRDPPECLVSSLWDGVDVRAPTSGGYSRTGDCYPSVCEGNSSAVLSLIVVKSIAGSKFPWI